MKELKVNEGTEPQDPVEWPMNEQWASEERDGQFHVYGGGTGIAKCGYGELGKAIAERIVADHNSALDRKQIKRHGPPRPSPSTVIS